MTEETFGPQGKRIEKPSYEEDIERFTRAFGFEPEPKYEPEEIPPESDWDDANRKNAFAEYFKRHPEAKERLVPKREILKLSKEQLSLKIAPNTTMGDYLPQLVSQLQVLMENHKRLSEKIAELEQKALDECTSKGPQFQWIDSECVRLDVTGDGANPENVAAKAAESATVDRIMDKVVSKGRFFRKQISLDGGWTILSGKGT